MIEFSRIRGFEWDEGNSRKSFDKHGITQREAEEVFGDPRLLILADEEHSKQENRFHAYGASAVGRLLLVSFTLRANETLIRVISARAMSRRERERYAEES